MLGARAAAGSRPLAFLELGEGFPFQSRVGCDKASLVLGRGVMAACLHAAVDGLSSVTYAEPLPDERKGPAPHLRRHPALGHRDPHLGPHRHDGGRASP